MPFAKEERNGISKRKKSSKIGKMSSKSHFSSHISQRQFGDPKVS
jgi:hypothetical protein